MVSRSANSSGRSRFLNHFSGEERLQPRAANRAQEGQAIGSSDPRKASRTSDAQGKGEAESDGEGRMVNGVPPGLPTTGIFGELLRRAKQQGIPTGPANKTGDADSGALSNGKMMLSDIERKLDAARREAQELQAQLTTVIGQNQSVMMALAHGNTSGSGSGSSSNNKNNNNGNIVSNGGVSSISGATAASAAPGAKTAASGMV
ncbi:hypothetical protein H4S06_004099 [Coemansia sp. BCRC 34490]|nr:hypothetical protein H4S06_004099 [Coemansia sp. BCRC 34490]